MVYLQSPLLCLYRLLFLQLLKTQLGCRVKDCFTLKAQNTPVFVLESLPGNYQSGVWEATALLAVIRLGMLETNRGLGPGWL